MTRKSLRESAAQIASNNNAAPSTPLTALRKLFVQEHRDWTRPGNPRIGWKRGEIFEVAEAAFTGGDWRSELGDVGYYVAQTWPVLWWLYAAITPAAIIQRAVVKFQGRAGVNHD